MENNNDFSCNNNFATWAGKWLKIYKQPNVSAETFESTYKNSVEKHLIPYFGKEKLSNIKPIDIQAFFLEKISLSESMLEKLELCLNGIFETAIDNDICFKNPNRHIKVVSKAKKHIKRVYSEEEIIRVENIMNGVFDEAIVLLETGIRRGELLAITKNDIDFENDILSINKAITGKNTSALKIVPPKWNSFRDIPITSKRCMLIFKRLCQTKSKYIFLSKNDTLQVPNAFSQRAKRIFEKYLPDDIEKLSSHELRHTYGTNLRRKGVDIYTIQKVMGHKDIKMTSELYVHNEVDQLRKAMFQIE